MKDLIGPIVEWLAFQSAKYCVENRLRTVYGKAFQTLTAIEGKKIMCCLKVETTVHITSRLSYLFLTVFTETIRLLARETVCNEKLSDAPASARRARLLIQFVEQFEKLLYNAVEGTASAFQPASKVTVTCH